MQTVLNFLNVILSAIKTCKNSNTILRTVQDTTGAKKATALRVVATYE